MLQLGLGLNSLVDLVTAGLGMERIPQGCPLSMIIHRCFFISLGVGIYRLFGVSYHNSMLTT